jgi:hypothetical protein
MSQRNLLNFSKQIGHLGLKRFIVESVWASVQYGTKRYPLAQIVIITADGELILYKNIYREGYNYIENFKGKIINSSFQTHPLPILTVKTENGGILRLDAGEADVLHFIPIERLDGRVKWTELLCDSQRVIFGTDIPTIYDKRIKDNNYARLDLK